MPTQVKSPTDTPQTEPKRPVALLDIDDTLILKGKDINTQLIEKLKANGIKDIYSFTDMHLTSSRIEERLLLKGMLEAQGFKVRGFITPMDLAWQEATSSQEAQKLGKKAAEFMAEPEVQGGGKLSGSPLGKILKSRFVLQKYLSYQRYARLPADKIKPGSAFEEGEAVYNAQIKKDPKKKGSGFNLPFNLGERSGLAKVLGDRNALNKGYDHAKGLMLEAFLANKPEWVSSIVMADDHVGALRSIDQCKTKIKPNIPISTIKIEPRKISNDPNNVEASRYDALMKEHMKQDPSVTNNFKHQIDLEIARLEKSKGNPLLKDPQLLIKALNQLKDRIDLGVKRNQSLGEIVEAWEKSIIAKDATKVVTVGQLLDENRNVLGIGEKTTKELVSQFKIDLTRWEGVKSRSLGTIVSDLKERFQKWKKGSATDNQTQEQVKTSEASATPESKASEPAGASKTPEQPAPSGASSTADRADTSDTKESTNEMRL